MRSLNFVWPIDVCSLGVNFFYLKEVVDNEVPWDGRIIDMVALSGMFCLSLFLETGAKTYLPSLKALEW